MPQWERWRRKPGFLIEGKVSLIPSLIPLPRDHPSKQTKKTTSLIISLNWTRPQKKTLLSRYLWTDIYLKVPTLVILWLTKSDPWTKSLITLWILIQTTTLTISKVSYPNLPHHYTLWSPSTEVLSLSQVYFMCDRFTAHTILACTHLEYNFLFRQIVTHKYLLAYHFLTTRSIPGTICANHIRSTKLHGIQISKPPLQVRGHHWSMLT